MVWLVLRPQHDAAFKSDGSQWISTLRGHEVDPSLGNTQGYNGGILLDPAQPRWYGNPIIRERQAVPDGTYPDGNPRPKLKITHHQRTVLKTRKGEDANKKDPASGTTEYLCEPCEYDAVYLSKLRPGWTYQTYQEAAHVPRRGAPAAPQGPSIPQPVLPAEASLDLPPIGDDTNVEPEGRNANSGGRQEVTGLG